jgi:hypothetical protein
MRRYPVSLKNNLSVRNAPRFLVPLLLLMTALPLFGAEPSVEYELIARSGVTPIPNGVGTFSGFNPFPAIDDNGNVMFGALGSQSQVGIYTAIGVCCQKVIDRNTLLPGGQGDTFSLFGGTDQNDIDDGRVAFRASGQLSGEALYTNVGQASPGDLVKVAAIDGVNWSAGGEPWIDGDTVAMWGEAQPADEYSMLYWDGSTSLEDPGAGYAMQYETQASISGDASIFQRYHTSTFNTELVIATASGYEILVERNVTPMPGDESKTFLVLPQWPVIEQGGQDAAFIGMGPLQRGVYKRVNGGSLQRVADKSTVVPGSGGQLFTTMKSDQLALANGQVVFVGEGSNLVSGIYTDVGGQLSVVADDQANNTIELNGQDVEITAIRLSTKSFAYTAQGYQVVFLAYLKSGGSAIIRATIGDAPGGSTDSFMVFKDFSDNNTSSVSVSLNCSSGSVSNSPQWASEASPAVFTIDGAAPGATCTAVESVPSGYSANASECRSVPLLAVGGCEIFNTVVAPSADMVFEGGFEG